VSTAGSGVTATALGTPRSQKLVHTRHIPVALSTGRIVCSSRNTGVPGVDSYSSSTGSIMKPDARRRRHLAYLGGRASA
jgi:hypothetical protein